MLLFCTQSAASLLPLSRGNEFCATHPTVADRICWNPLSSGLWQQYSPGITEAWRSLQTSSVDWVPCHTCIFYRNRSTHSNNRGGNQTPGTEVEKRNQIFDPNVSRLSLSNSRQSKSKQLVLEGKLRATLLLHSSKGEWPRLSRLFRSRRCSIFAQFCDRIIVFARHWWQIQFPRRRRGQQWHCRWDG